MNPLRLTLVALGALVAVLVVSVLAVGYADANDWAARVDGHEIAESELLEELAQFRANPGLDQSLGPGADGTVPSQLAGLWLNRLIQQRLVEDLAAEEGIRATAEHRRQAEAVEIQQFQSEDVWRAFPKWFRDRLVRRDAVFLAVIEELGGQVTEADLLEEYEAAQEELLQACAAHILVETQEQADALKAELDAGGDFAALAQQHSIDEGSGSRGGDLGCQRRNAYVEPFDSQVFVLPLDTVSDPVQTQFGFHLIKVSSREVTPFEEVREELRQRAQTGAQERFGRFLLQRVEEAEVEVNPKYGEFQFGLEGPQVLSPPAPAPSDGLPVDSGPDEGEAPPLPVP